MTTTSTPRVSPGRPRDPDADRRICEAAIALFGDVGWSGFSVEAVARNARVGKATIYLRWATKESLLVSALEHGLAHIEDIDTGSARGDLVELTLQLLDVQLGANGDAAIRLWLDTPKIPEVREWAEAFARSRVLAARAIVKRGIARKELPPSTSATLLLDALIGGAVMHVLSTPRELRPKVSSNAGAYAEALVDFLLGSTVSADTSTAPRRR